LTVARADIDQAIMSIQVAEQQGATNSDLLPLVDQLNLALEYENNASLVEQSNQTLADSLANASITISTQVSASAVHLGSDAEAASAYGKTAAYGIALVLAVIASVLVFDLDRLKRRTQDKRFGKQDAGNGRPIQ
jgi:hypothetical protein